ncbi:hypothetical protein SteCoe_3633 [Stentor coeruleus]|uniref:Uncharacterized protein n=1 Tax=Stentor coeruleus TaxID=5963 RepID=A0A1R2CWQ0_9CILI|nr:hypothetical protein SteCoe_3633 [Stentor coeruleus]
MRKIILICALVSFAKAGVILDDIQDVIGNSCMTNPLFLVSSFTVRPWPPVIGSVLFVNMTGIFQINEYVSEMIINTYYNHIWESEDYNINESFDINSSTSFLVTISSGNSYGNYVQQVIIFGGNLTLRHLACWQFAYSI